MAISSVSGAGVSGVQSTAPLRGADAKPQFSQSIKGQLDPKTAPRLENASIKVQPADGARAQGVEKAKAGTLRADAKPCVDSVKNARAQNAVQVLDQVSQAQKRMDQVLALAQSGKNFSPAELLALQTNMYRASQELDLAGKVVEKATGGVKQILQTQV